MSARRWYTEAELVEAKRLFHEDRLNWPDIARLLGRDKQALRRKLAKECSRPLSEVHRIKYEMSKRDGPRFLPSEDARRHYNKLRRLGYSLEQALEAART